MKTSNAKTVRGSCACGEIHYETQVDVSQGGTKCNCTACTKTQAWSAATEGPLTWDKGENLLTRYVAGQGAEHGFCSKCGTRLYAQYPDMKGETKRSIHLNTVDGLDFEGLPVKYVDGLHDTWSTLGDGRWSFVPQPVSRN